MPCAEFGIIDNFDKNKDYRDTYEPKKYNCVSIDDDILNDWWSELSLIKTYFYCYNRPELSLSRWGVTLIPPESLEAFFNIVHNDRRFKSSQEVIDLMIVLRTAITEGKYVIHYGYK